LPWQLLTADTSELTSFDETPATIRHLVMRKSWRRSEQLAIAIRALPSCRCRRSDAETRAAIA
jgi:hypothetical protein